MNEQQLDANDASEARFYVGESYQNMGEYRKAIEAYYKVSYHGAGGFSQWITSADFQRAKCHESMGEYATAIAVYERIVQRKRAARRREKWPKSKSCHCAAAFKSAPPIPTGEVPWT